MKTKLSIFYAFFITFFCYGEQFNYYLRNEITGVFIIKNIENVPPEYKLQYNFSDDKIVGYYYDSNTVKFVDEIKNNRVQKITYYDQHSGKVVFEKFFYYDEDCNINSFELVVKDSQGAKQYEQRCSFLKCDSNIAYNSFTSLKKGHIEQYTISDGTFSLDYKPLLIKTESIQHDKIRKLSNVSHLEEIVSYKNENEYTYKCIINGILQELHEVYFDDKAQYMNECYFDFDKSTVSSKKNIIKDSRLVQNISDGENITENKFEYQKLEDACVILKYDDWDNEPCVKIEVFDEIIHIKNKTQSFLKLPIDIMATLNHEF